MTEDEHRLLRARYLWNQAVSLDARVERTRAEAEILRSAAIRMTTPEERRSLTTAKGIDRVQDGTKGRVR